jgi:hypothetical protein
MLQLKTYKGLKILDFDIENRPLSYWIPDMPTAEITAIAWAWSAGMAPRGRERVVKMDACYLLGRDDPEFMLEQFVWAYNEADMVTGHYIRKHDLPHINGALMEYGMPQLLPKLVQDTRVDMKKKAGIPATQEHLSEMLGLPFPKIHMSQQDWREANRLTPEGLQKTEARVTGDVRQHMALRSEMTKRGLLKAPRIWYP